MTLPDGNGSELVSVAPKVGPVTTSVTLLGEQLLGLFLFVCFACLGKQDHKSKEPGTKESKHIK